ncbi:MAG: type II toxin-antitoxin system VapC family toxin [Blastocatellia bacterium]
MKLATCLFDTQVYIAHKNQVNFQQPGWLSAVVLQELTVGANGRDELDAFRITLHDYAARERLIVPNEEAWYQAGRILNIYLSDLSRADQQRRRPGLDHYRKQNLIRDVLIAVSAKHHGVTVISDNEDFPTIQRYYKFKFIRAKKFFA